MEGITSRVTPSSIEEDYFLLQRDVKKKQPSSPSSGLGRESRARDLATLHCGGRKGGGSDRETAKRDLT